MAGQFDFGSQPGAAEPGLDSQVTPPAVVAEVLDGEREPVDLDPVQGLQRRQGEFLLWCGEVEVCGEATAPADAPVVAGEVTFGDARHEPVPTLR